MILLFGAGVECQVVLHYGEPGHQQAYGSYLSCTLAWAAGVAMAVWMSGGISGGECSAAILNPPELFSVRDTSCL